jgi:hypothetical protein
VRYYRPGSRAPIRSRLASDDGNHVIYGIYLGGRFKVYAIECA